MSQEKLIEGLQKALNREVSTAIRYIRQAAVIKGAQWEPVRQLYQQEIDDEVGHAKYLATKIAALGGTPDVAPEINPLADDVPAMLAFDIEQEQIDTKHYLEMAELADKLGLADLKVQMEDQAADEARHGEEMRRLLG